MESRDYGFIYGAKFWCPNDSYILKVSSRVAEIVSFVATGANFH